MKTQLKTKLRQQYQNTIKNRLAGKVRNLVKLARKSDLERTNEEQKFHEAAISFQRSADSPIISFSKWKQAQLNG